MTKLLLQRRLSKRGQAGFSLIALGIFMVAFALPMVVFVAPPSFAHGGFPHGDQNCDPLGVELAEADPATQKQPWFPLLAQTDQTVRVFKRGERSFVVIYPRTPKQ